MKKKEKDEELFIAKNKFIVLKVILVLLLIGGIGYGIYYYYHNYYSNPNKVINNIVEKANELIDNNLITPISKNEKVQINGLLKVEMDLGKEYQDLANIINNLSIQISAQMDIENNINKVDVNTKYKDSKLINAKTYSDENNTYFYLEDIYDKYLKINSNTIIQNSNQNNIIDCKIVLKEMLKELKDTLNKYSFVRKEETLTIEDTEYKVYNNYLTLKNDDIKKFITTLCTKLLNNQKFIESMNKIIEDDAKKMLEDIINNVKEITFDKTYTLSFYTEKGLEQNLIAFKQIIKSEEENVILELLMPNKNNYLINIQDDELDIACKLYVDENTLNVNLEFNDDDKQFKLIGNFNYDKIEKLDEVDITNSINIEKLDEEDLQIINGGFANNKTLQELVQNITDIITKQQNNIQKEA